MKRLVYKPANTTTTTVKRNVHDPDNAEGTDKNQGFTKTFTNNSSFTSRFEDHENMHRGSESIKESVQSSPKSSLRSPSKTTKLSPTKAVARLTPNYITHGNRYNYHNDNDALKRYYSNDKDSVEEMMETLDMLIAASNGSNNNQNTFISDAKRSFIKGKYLNIYSQYSNLAGYYSNNYDKKKNTLSTIDHIHDMHTGDKSTHIAETIKAIREVKSLLWNGSRKKTPIRNNGNNNFMRRTAKAIGSVNVKRSLGNFFKKQSGRWTNRLGRLKRSSKLRRFIR